MQGISNKQREQMNQRALTKKIARWVVERNRHNEKKHTPYSIFISGTGQKTVRVRNRRDVSEKMIVSVWKCMSES